MSKSLTSMMKKWLNDNAGVPADAGDFEFHKAMGAAIAEGKLPVEEYEKLMADPEAAPANEFSKKLDEILTVSKSNADRIAALEKGATVPADAGNDGASTFGVGRLGQVFAKAAVADVRVKSVREKFVTDRKTLSFPMVTKAGHPHPMGGQTMEDPITKSALYESSEFDKAVCGAYVKFVINCERGGLNIPPPFRMSEVDEQLLKYAIHELPWGGELSGGTKNPIMVENERLTGWMQKALLDDGTSGGIDLAPTVFDDAIIKVPYLNGEVFPRVTVVPIPRGRRIEGAIVGQVTLSSGGADATDIPLFSTAAFVSAFDTQIFTVNGAVEIGLDFMSDSPIAVGQIFTDQYGDALLSWLDEQVQLGDGSTEPQGIFNCPGTVLVSASSANLTIGGLLQMLFGVPKQYKTGTPNSQLAYCGTEETYRRARAITIGDSYNALALGQNVESYTVFDHPWAVSGAQTNAQVSFTNYKRYRMYRRLGATFKTTTEGKTLVRANEMMISMRARFGGQLEDGNACVIVTDAAV